MSELISNFPWLFVGPVLDLCCMLSLWPRLAFGDLLADLSFTSTDDSLEMDCTELCSITFGV